MNTRTTKSRRSLGSVAALAAAAAGLLSGCSVGNNPAAYAACTDTRTGFPLPPQDCAVGAGYGYSAWDYIPWALYSAHRSYYSPGARVNVYHYHVLTKIPPKTSAGTSSVQFAGKSKPVTVFNSGKQAGTPVKNSQDAPSYRKGLKSKSSGFGTTTKTFRKK